MESRRDLESPLESQSEERNEGKKEVERTRAYLSWKDLKVTLDAKRYLLQGLSGYAEPGRLLAIMGPSGSGKSTLLDTLAGRQARDAIVTGEILVNGHKQNLSYGSVAYVAQDVVLLGTLTVYETLYYSAKLRFKDSNSASETKRLVMNAIEDVGLVDVMNTRIGSWYKRGVSGGEKRRVSIAVELLTSPTLIFLDEPTSGLDSASSFHVIKTLKDLARADRTILCSIHQPSSEVFELFDDLCLLSDGQQVYYGPLPRALQFFERNEYPCPPLRSPADHYLHCINSAFDSVDRIFIQQESTPRSSPSRAPFTIAYNRSRKSAKQVVTQLTQAYKLSEDQQILDSQIENISQMDGGYFESKGSHASFHRQTIYLTMRSFVNMNRDIGYYWLRLLMYVGLCLCIGTMFFNVGHIYSSIQARAAAFTYMVSFLSFMAVGGFPSFIEDMKVFHTERLNGYYGVGPFAVANTLSSMPFILLIAVVSTAIAYPLVRFQTGVEEVVYFILALNACLLVSKAIMMAVSSLVSQFLVGILFGAGLTGAYMLAFGFFRLPNHLPLVYWRYPLFYVSYLAYGFQGMMENEFLGLTFDGMNPGDPHVNGDYFLSVLYEITLRRSKWWNLAVLYFMFLGYRVLFFILLKCGENLSFYQFSHFPNTDEA